MTFADAILQALGVITLTAFFGCSLVARRMEINHRPLRPLRSRETLRGRVGVPLAEAGLRGAGGLRACAPDSERAEVAADAEADGCVHGHGDSAPEACLSSGKTKEISTRAHVEREAA